MYIIERENLVIRQADKGNTIVITDCTIYLEDKRNLISDSNKLMKFAIDVYKYINYILKLERKLIDCFKVIENKILKCLLTT